jgi:hypothetical protein
MSHPQSASRTGNCPPADILEAAKPLIELAIADWMGHLVKRDNQSPAARGERKRTTVRCACSVLANRAGYSLRRLQ